METLMETAISASGGAATTPLRVFKNSKTFAVATMKFSPDGRYFIVAQRDGTSLVYDVLSGGLQEVLKDDTLGLECGTISKDSRLYITCDDQGSVYVYDLQTMDLIFSVNTGRYHCWVTISERHIAFGGGDRALYIFSYDLQKKKIEKVSHFKDLAQKTNDFLNENTNF